MRKLFIAALCAALCLAWSAQAAQAAGPDRPNMDALALSQDSLKFEAAPAAGNGGPPSVIFLITPEFYYGEFGALRTTLDGVELAQEGGESKGFGVTFMVTKPFTEVFSLSFIFQWAYNEYDGGNLFPVVIPGRGWTNQHATSQMAGLIADFNLGRFGKLQPSVLVGWDSYHGTEFIESPAIGDSQGEPAISDDRALSLMVWYTNDFALSDSLTLTPYLGWRSVHVVLNNLGHHQQAWAHLASGGLSLKYSAGALALVARAGVNYRVSRDDIPGLSTRAVAPGVTHMGWMTSWDRTIATYGLALDYNFGPGILEISYDGFAGSEATYHKGAVVLDFPF